MSGLPFFKACVKRSMFAEVRYSTSKIAALDVQEPSPTCRLLAHVELVAVVDVI